MRKDRSTTLARTNCFFNPVNISLTDIDAFSNVRFHRQKRTDTAARLIPLSLAWLEQILDLGVLAVDQEMEARRRLSADGQYSSREMASQRITENVREKIIEYCHQAPRIEVKNVFGDNDHPVLLSVAQCIDRPQQSRIQHRQLGVLSGQIDAFIMPNAGLLYWINYPHSTLDQDRLEKHLACVL